MQGEDTNAAFYRPPSRACALWLLRSRRRFWRHVFGRAAEAWPTRPVRYVNGFPAGGATDTLSRILCQKMSELSGQSFVVENRAGAGGVLGGDAVAKSAPDGYTIGLGGIATNVLAIGTYAKLPYDPREDFTFIGGMWQLPNILCARKDLPFCGPEGFARPSSRRSPANTPTPPPASAPRCISPAR